MTSSDRRPPEPEQGRLFVSGVEPTTTTPQRELACVLLLDSIPSFGPQKFRLLVDAGASPASVVEDPAQVSEVPQLARFRDEITARAEGSLETFDARARDLLDRAAAVGGHVLTYSRPEYPSILLGSAYPLPLLFAQGDVNLLQNPAAIACVGSRKIRSPYSELQRSTAQRAAKAGAVVVSGFALGADTIAHVAARDAGGATLAVLPSGLDRPYPPENQDLWKELLDYPRALFVTQFPFGTRTSRITLVTRNKLISALSRAVLVGQSGVRGGAMHAYRAARELNRAVATFASDNAEDTGGNLQIEKEQREGDMILPLDGGSAGEFEKWLLGLSS